MPEKMPKYRSVGEVFEHLKKLSKNAEKIELLQINASPALYYLLKLALNDVKWLLPDGAPPFRQDIGAIGMNPSTLLKELRTLYLYLEGGNDALKQLRREQLFKQFLERLHKDESALILAIKDKQFAKTYKCTKALVDQAFPGLLDLPFKPNF